jgi:hypothetical protein
MTTLQFSKMNNRRVGLVIELLAKKSLSLEDWEELGFLQARLDEYLAEFLEDETDSEQVVAVK